MEGSTETTPAEQAQPSIYTASLDTWRYHKAERDRLLAELNPAEQAVVHTIACGLVEVAIEINMARRYGIGTGKQGGQ